MSEETAWIWFKTGDHWAEGHRLCQQCGEETRDVRSGGVSVRTTNTPSGKTLTVIVADGPWWREQMRVHPNGWRGAYFSEALRAAGL
jgi:hypothetical protein